MVVKKMCDIWGGYNGRAENSSQQQEKQQVFNEGFKERETLELGPEEWEAHGIDKMRNNLRESRQRGVER